MSEPTRVPRRYLLVLKESLSWQHKSAEPRALTPSMQADEQQRMNADAQTVHQIAQALAAQYGGQVLSEMHGALHGFVVNLPDAQVQQMALDPRVGSITDHVIKQRMAGSPP